MIIHSITVHPIAHIMLHPSFQRTMLAGLGVQKSHIKNHAKGDPISVIMGRESHHQ